MSLNLEQQVKLAKEGNKAALEAIVNSIKSSVYGLSLRMLGHPEDAEDQTQEILIKVITNLSNFREESAFKTWVYKIASNHLLTKQKQFNARPELTFESFGEIIGSMTEHAPTLEASNPERTVLLEETRLGCMQAALSCLDKEVRIAMILTESYGVTSKEGAFILGITPEAYRARLSRSKKSLQEFMTQHCGLVRKDNACQCHQPAAIRLSQNNQANTDTFVIREIATHGRATLLAKLDELSEIDRTIAMFRRYPEYQTPDSFLTIVSTLISSGAYSVFN